jgi:hypothetical protein
LAPIWASALSGRLALAAGKGLISGAEGLRSGADRLADVFEDLAR